LRLIIAHSVCGIRAKSVAHQTGAYTDFCTMKGLGVFLLPLDGMLVHPRVTTSIKFAGTHLYTWVERGTHSLTHPHRAHEDYWGERHCESKLSFPRTQHNTVSPGRVRTRTAGCGDERTFIGKEPTTWQVSSIAVNSPGELRAGTCQVELNVDFFSISFCFLSCFYSQIMESRAVLELKMEKLKSPSTRKEETANKSVKW